MFLEFVGRLALAGALYAWAWPSHAQPLTLQEAIGRTLASNPALRAEGASIDALEMQARLDSLAPPLTLGAELENVAGTGEVSGVKGAEATLRLGRVLELGGKREARHERARADIALQQNVIVLRRIELAASTTRHFVAVVEAQAVLELARRQVTLADEVRSAVQHRVSRGVAPDGDLAMAEIASARAELAREHAEHELQSARYSLAALWGAQAPEAVEASGDLLDLPELPEFEYLSRRLADTPGFVAYELDLTRLDAEREIAVAAAHPDLALTAGVRRLEAYDDQALVFSLSMPFGISERSAHAVARSTAQADATVARRDAALLDARQALYANYQELRHARTEVLMLAERMIPSAERGLALTRAGYDDARYSLLELTQAQATWLQLQRERLAAAARYHTLLAEIERSTAIAGATP